MMTKVEARERQNKLLKHDRLECLIIDKKEKKTGKELAVHDAGENHSL